MMQNLINPSGITNKDRVHLAYQAVITLEAQTWAMRSGNQCPLKAAVDCLEAVEQAINEKYPLISQPNQGGHHGE